VGRISYPWRQPIFTSVTVVDLHADSLLWGRDLLQQGDRGHVDIPRLVEGNVALQVFAMPTKVPRNLNIERNDDRTDDIALVALIQGWPAATLRSLLARAEYQAGRLRAMSAASGGALTLIRTAADLEGLLTRRRDGDRVVGGLLAIEGAHALDGDPANVDRLFDAGYRMVGLAHFFDNAFAGSAHGLVKGGLTAAGREVVERLEQRSILVDLAHASAATIDDVLASRPGRSSFRTPVSGEPPTTRETCPMTSSARSRRRAGSSGSGSGRPPAAARTPLRSPGRSSTPAR